MEWLLLLGFLMGWAVGWIQGSAIPKARVEQLEMDLALAKAHLEQTETELVWARTTIQAKDLDLARWSAKNSEWAKEMVEQLRSRTEMEKPSQSEYQMSESAKAQALSKGWAWVLGQENSPKQ